MALPKYLGTLGRAWHYGFRIYCGLVFVFLIAPLLVIIPLSFNAEPYFTFTEEMLRLEPNAYSMRWYEDIINKNSGKVLKVEEWGLRNLSHIIKNNKKGFYVHIKFDGTGKTIEELEKAENIDQMLIRYLSV